MRDPLLVTDVTFTEASPDRIRRGVLGYVTCLVGGQLRLDDLRLRRSQEGRTYVEFPKHRDSVGILRPTVKPIDEAARRAIEAQVFLAIGIGHTIHFRSTATSRERRP